MPAKRLFDDFMWFLNVPLTLLYAVWLGRFIQLSADSGQYRPEAVMETIFATVGAFVLGVLLAFILKLWRSNLPIWVLSTLIGSFLFAIFYGVIIFVLRSNNTAWHIITEEFSFLLGRVLFQTLLAFIPIFFLLLAINTVAVYIRAHRNASHS